MNVSAGLLIATRGIFPSSCLSGSCRRVILFPLRHEVSSTAAINSDHSPGKSRSSTSRYQKHHKRFMDSKERVLANIRNRKDSLSQDFKNLALKENILTVPNLLCVIRIGLTPYIGYLVLNNHYHWACYVFAFAGFTDLLDGWIARRYPSQRSMAGSFLDPLADKFLVTTLVLTLTAVHLIPVPLTALIVARDICLVAAACIVRYRSLPPPVTIQRYFDVSFASAKLSPTTLSKYNTGIQLALVLATLGAPVFGYIDHQALHVLWYITAVSTLVSSASYVFQKDTVKYLIPKSQRKTP